MVLVILILLLGLLISVVCSAVATMGLDSQLCLLVGNVGEGSALLVVVVENLVVVVNQLCVVVNPPGVDDANGKLTASTGCLEG